MAGMVHSMAVRFYSFSYFYFYSFLGNEVKAICDAHEQVPA